ncbi:Hypp4625 [Branchiostoma lanceolatum]|uniref:Hypp4625 protein n=1 Tax=Branchiostoma lanceolatum TaxID=7740 RepID=A0A8K0AEM9_BRALA|nr:Hypp4625 [Branchiostoma lanceolatum]
MKFTRQIVVMLMLAGGLSVTADTETVVPPLDLCPPGYGWAREIQDCLDCAVCDSMPETSICPDCRGDSVSAGISSDKSFRQAKVEEIDTANFESYRCPSGYGWDPVNSDCMPCSVCDDMPDTNICDKCAEAKDDEEIRQPIQESVGPEEIADKETVV